MSHKPNNKNCACNKLKHKSENFHAVHHTNCKHCTCTTAEEKHEEYCGTRVSPNITCSCSTPPVTEEKHTDVCDKHQHPDCMECFYTTRAEVKPWRENYERTSDKARDVLLKMQDSEPTTPDPWEEEFDKLWQEIPPRILSYLRLQRTEAYEQGKREGRTDLLTALKDELGRDGLPDQNGNVITLRYRITRFIEKQEKINKMV